MKIHRYLESEAMNMKIRLKRYERKLSCNATLERQIQQILLILLIRSFNPRDYEQKLSCNENT
jgi:hypothetical protein